MNGLLKASQSGQKKEKVRLSLDVSGEMNELLEAMAESMHTSKADVLRRSVALMEILLEARDQGKHFGIASDREALETAFIGV